MFKVGFELMFTLPKRKQKELAAKLNKNFAVKMKLYTSCYICTVMRVEVSCRDFILDASIGIK